MFDIPFHVAGEASGAAPQLPDTALSGRLHAPLLAAGAKAWPRGSRRRKLWELLPKFHCPVIGVCFEADDLRALMSRVMTVSRETTDFVLHTTAVGECETRTQLSALLHKQLEKRFQLQVRKFSCSKDAHGLHALWRESCATGSDIPGALWASWTHPACDSTLEQEIFRDIHMIQHQVGSGTRADLSRLNALRTENTELRGQLLEARAETQTQRAEKLGELHLLIQQIAKLRADLGGKEGLVATLTGQLDTLRQSLPDLKDRQLLARRARDADARATALRARAVELEDEVERLRRLAGHAEATIEQLIAVGDRVADNADAVPNPLRSNLSGKRILCVGGRSGSVDAYRKVVEQRGGNFFHHDGGLEESLHRIDAALAAADLVVCQAGCISHNAYWRVKEKCKRTGKQCVFLKSPGIVSFDRVIGAIRLRETETTLDELPDRREQIGQ